MGFSRFFRKSQPFQHIGLWNFDKVNIFKINKCKKIFFEKFPFFRGVALIKKKFFGQNFFAHVSGKNKTFVKIFFFFFFFFFFFGAPPVFKIFFFRGGGGVPYGPVFYCRSDKSASVLICLVFILYIWQTCPWTPPACMSRRGVTQSDISLCHFLPDYFYQQTLLRNVRFSHLCDQSCPDDRNSRLFHK